MLTTYLLITVLMLPGMTEPLVSREATESLEDCMAKVQALADIAHEHDGQQYKFLLACEMTGNKADPA